MKTVEIHIAVDGTITAETKGYTGKSCMSVLPLLESLLPVRIMDSSFVEESNRDIGNQTQTTLKAHMEG